MAYIFFLLFTFLVLVFVFYQWQFYMVFTPTYNRKEKLCGQCSLLEIKLENERLEGVIYEPLHPKSTMLFFAGRSHDVVGIISKLSNLYPNVRIISFNYRSYGKSTGKITEQALLSDGVKIADLVQKNYGDFYLLGYSLGSNIASYIASKRRVKSLILIGAFDSIASLAKSKFVDRGFFPMIDLSTIFRYKLRTGVYVQSVDSDTYLLVSKSDETTYIQNARELKSKIKNLVYYDELEGLSHKEILWDSKVVQKINSIINE